MADHIERIRAVLADRYRIDREIGRGGMAKVYLAQDLNPDVLPDGSQFVAVVHDSTAQLRAPMLRVFVNWPAVRPLQPSG